MNLYELLALVPQGHNWLIRSDKERGFFANIMTHDFVNGPQSIDGVHRFYSYAPTPEQALQQALEQCIQRRIQYDLYYMCVCYAS